MLQKVNLVIKGQSKDWRKWGEGWHTGKNKFRNTSEGRASTYLKGPLEREEEEDEEEEEEEEDVIKKEISQYGLFIKLMERNVPLCFLFIVMYWYLNMQ